MAVKATAWEEKEGGCDGREAKLILFMMDENCRLCSIFGRYCFSDNHDTPTAIYVTSQRKRKLKAYVFLSGNKANSLMHDAKLESATHSSADIKLHRNGFIVERRC